MTTPAGPVREIPVDLLKELATRPTDALVATWFDVYGNWVATVEDQNYALDVNQVFAYLADWGPADADGICRNPVRWQLTGEFIAAEVQRVARNYGLTEPNDRVWAVWAADLALAVECAVVCFRRGEDNMANLLRLEPRAWEEFSV